MNELQNRRQNIADWMMYSPGRLMMEWHEQRDRHACAVDADIRNAIADDLAMISRIAFYLYGLVL